MINKTAIYILVFLAAAVLLKVADYAMATFADRWIRSDGISVSRDLAILKPDFRFPKVGQLHYCRGDTVFYIYLYKICFVPYDYHSDPAKFGFFYTYFQPKSYTSIFFPARSFEDYYFNESVLGEKLGFVDISGDFIEGLTGRR